MKPCFDAVKQDHSDTTIFSKVCPLQADIFDINNVFDAVKKSP